MVPFSHSEHFPGVYHITDPMGVQFTLIIQEDHGGALLFDTAYGIHDPRPYLQGFLRKHGLGVDALTVLVSHAHYDHLPGVRWFDSFSIHRDELPALETYTGDLYLRRVYFRALERTGIPPGFVEDAFFHADYRGKAVSDLPAVPGIDILHIPGHTPGSLVLYLRKHRLLLTADNWNPTTWLFFPEALPVREYAKNMQGLLALDFDHVFCSHSDALISGERLRRYIRGLTEETFAGAVPTETPYPEFKTLLCHPEPDTSFVFRG